MASESPKYTKEQVTQYYERINLPDALRIYEVAGVSAKAALSYLKELQKHHLVSVPFENLVSCVTTSSEAMMSNIQ
jgi:arylamine N-acetyltransferase